MFSEFAKSPLQRILEGERGILKRLPESSLGIPNPLFEVENELQDRFIAQPPIHEGITCGGSLCGKGGEKPEFICGLRYKCLDCDDIDFCAQCVSSISGGGLQHDSTHSFLQLHITRCAICQDMRHLELRPGDEFRGPYKEFSTLVETLRRVANDRECGICTFIWTALLQMPPKVNWTLEEQSSITIRLRLPFSCCLEIAVVSDQGKTSSEFEFGGETYIDTRQYVDKMEDALHAYMCLAPSYPVTPTDILSDEFITKVNRDSGSEEAFHLVRAWLQDCREKHVKCLPTIFSAPARVLDLQGPDQDMVYLKETKGACCPYAALSYCWGPTFCSDTEIATLKENVQLFQDNGILIEDLPKTLREAVQATRRLDIRYLWIDRLCIIQDDSSDWMSNASLMCDVYSGAEITLSADHSSSTQGGLFNDNQSYSNFEYHPYVDPDGELTHRQLLIPPSHPIFEGQVLENTHPVDSRAWILQERLMSHRILHFTSQEMVWECNEATTCECRRGSSSPTRALTTPPPGGWTTEILYSEWRDIVKSYKMRTLTEPADEFPALKGIATKFYRLLQGCSAIGGMSDNYMAGMWKNNLAAEMAWKRGNDADTESFRRRIKSNKAPESKDKTKGEGKEDIQERIRAWRQDQLDPTDKYIAPSWSWASQPGPKDYYRYWPEVPFQSQIDLVDVQLTPRSANDPWGQLESGYITISGHMVKNMELVTAFGLFEQEGTDERKGAPVYYLEYSAGSMRWVIGFEADDPGELIDEYRLQEPKFVLLLLGTIDTKKVPPRIFGLSSPFIYLLTKREYLKDESSNEASPAVAKSSAPPSVDHQTGEFRRDSIYLVLVESNDHPGKYQRLGCMEVGLMTEHRLLMQDLFMYSVKQEITLV